MLQLEHMERIAQACAPDTVAEFARFWHDCKPVKFGNAVPWTTGAPVTLADYHIPGDAAYLLVLRVESYTTTFVATAPGFGLFSPPPPGTAHWMFTDSLVITDDYRITPDEPTHIFLDTDEFLFVKGGQKVSLLASLDPPPDANPRIVRTLVYAYLVGALIADRLGPSETTYFSE